MQQLQHPKGKSEKWTMRIKIGILQFTNVLIWATLHLEGKTVCTILFFCRTHLSEACEREGETTFENEPLLRLALWKTVLFVVLVALLDVRVAAVSKFENPTDGQWLAGDGPSLKWRDWGRCGFGLTGCAIFLAISVLGEMANREIQ